MEFACWRVRRRVRLRRAHDLKEIATIIFSIAWDRVAWICNECVKAVTKPLTMSRVSSTVVCRFWWLFKLKT